MTYSLYIYLFLLKVCWFFIRLFPTRKNRIIMLSRQTNEPSIDFQYIKNDINKRYPEYEVIMLCKRLEKNNIFQIISYIFHPIVQMYYFATSSICIIDGYQIIVSNLKHKKNMLVIQIWHSLAAIKKFGYESLVTKKDKIQARIVNMHKGYDLVVSGSNEMTKYFAKCFNCSEDKFINTGLPRIDYLLDTYESNKKKCYKYYPELKNKKIVLYVPTFRANGEIDFDSFIDKFSDSDYEVVIKKHPRTKNFIDSKYTYNKLSSLELLSVADYVITDYSAISIEAAILNKKVVIYNFDEKEYRKNEGLNINLTKELKNCVYNNLDDLYNFIMSDKYNIDNLYKFKNKYASNVDGTSTKKIVDKIMECKYEK